LKNIKNIKHTKNIKNKKILVGEGRMGKSPHCLICLISWSSIIRNMPGLTASLY